MPLEQEQIGHDRDGHRAFDADGLFGDLCGPKPTTVFNSSTNSSIRHVRRYTPTISRAGTGSGRSLTRILVCSKVFIHK